MNAKDKAKELFKKFDDMLPCEGTTTGNTPIELGLIAINEIEMELIEWGEVWMKQRLNYWTDVATELKKL